MYFAQKDFVLSYGKVLCPDTDYLSKKEQQYLDKWIEYCREKELMSEELS